MAQILGPTWGSGKNGYLTVSGTQNINTYTSCTGSALGLSLTVTSSTGFVAGDLIMIHKSRGSTTTAVGTWELNRVASIGGATTLNLAIPLVNAYQDSGADQSQCVLVPEYYSVTVPTATTLAPTAWDGNVGGICAFACNGITDIIGTITGTGKGYLGTGSLSYQGEGTVGAGGNSTNANGNGGGGSTGGSSSGGGGSGTAGVDGVYAGNGAAGTGGILSGLAGLTNITFGGGSGSSNTYAGSTGGGIVIIFTKTITITGNITANGNDGTSNSGGGNTLGVTSGAGGGQILIKAQTATLGSTKITASAGAASTNNAANSSPGSLGAVGRIRIESLSRTGTTNPLASEVIGSTNSWAGNVGLIG